VGKIPIREDLLFLKMGSGRILDLRCTGAEDLVEMLFLGTSAREDMLFRSH
jgi:hypothetical protein